MLLLASQKCNYLVFSKRSESGAGNLDLRLFNERLIINESPTFLGIRHLTFKNQISYLQDSRINRLNFLKNISKRSFGLRTNTFNRIYIWLIRFIHNCT